MFRGSERILRDRSLDPEPLRLGERFYVGRGTAEPGSGAGRAHPANGATRNGSKLRLRTRRAACRDVGTSPAVRSFFTTALTAVQPKAMGDAVYNGTGTGGSRQATYDRR